MKFAARLVMFAIAVSSAAAELNAQERQEQTLLRFGYFATVNLDSNWYSVVEYQERRWDSPLEVHQRLVRGHLHRRVGLRGWLYLLP